MRLRHESILDLIDQEASVVPGGLASLDDLERRLASSVERPEPRQRATVYLRGLLSPAERNNSGPLAEISGDATPQGNSNNLVVHWGLSVHTASRHRPAV